MNNILPGNIYRHSDIKNATQLYRELKLFPTPFKGIYYAPYDSERGGWYITDPASVLFKAAGLYLRSSVYYFGLYSALYYLRIVWNTMGSDLINKKISRKLSKKLPGGNYWRAKIVRKILSSYPLPVRFHRIKNLSQKNTQRQGPVVFSNLEKTQKDAVYLCTKGDGMACEVLRMLQNTKFRRTRKPV